MEYPEIFISISIAQLIGFGIIVWKVATIYSEFNYRVSKNKDDLNGLSRRIENKVDYNYSIVNNSRTSRKERRIPFTNVRPLRRII